MDRPKLIVSFALTVIVLLLIADVRVSAAKDDMNKQKPAPSVTENSGVLVLTSDNFDDAISKNDLILVEFYAPECIHCKHFAPEYEKAAKRLKENDPPIVLAKVDAIVETQLATRFDVFEYPTLKWFKGGREFDYDGPRQADGIVNFMKERSGSHSKPLSEAMLVLTKNNFTKFTAKQELTVVIFYAAWCVHCKHLLPVFEEAAQELKNSRKGSPIPLAKVDAKAETNLAKKYDIKRYPTIKVFRRGKASSYKNGAQDKRGIVSYIESLRGPASKRVSVDDIWRQVSKSGDSAVLCVGFFNDASNAAFQIYEAAVNEMRTDCEYLHTFEMSAARQKYSGVNAGSLVIFLSERFQTKYENKSQMLQIKSKTKLGDVVSFIEKHKAPLVGQYGKRTIDTMYRDRRPLVLFFYAVDWTSEHRKETQAWRQKFSEIAKAHPDMTFSIADIKENSCLFNEFGFDDSQEISVAIIDTKERKFPMKAMEEFDSAKVEKFLKTFAKGNAKPKLKSESIPKKSSGPVTVVVGKTFDKVVLDNSKDVLIELYSPSNNDCKKLEPVYRDLAKRFKDVKQLVIAKMDATANDSPDPYTASGFPTIYFARAGKKSSPVSYSGDPSLQNLEKFIRDHATVSLRARVKDEL